MSIYMVEGSSQITTNNVSYGMVAGTVISVPLDDAGTAAGPPSLPAAYDLADLTGLPVAYLDRPVTIAPPLDEISLGQLIRANLGKDEDDTEDEDDLDGDLGAGGIIGDPGGTPGDADHKMTICHNGKTTIIISLNAWPTHQEHGDTEGPCPVGDLSADQK